MFPSQVFKENDKSRTPERKRRKSQDEQIMAIKNMLLALRREIEDVEDLNVDKPVVVNQK